jgi:hypothetical protein
LEFNFSEKQKQIPPFSLENGLMYYQGEVKNKVDCYMFFIVFVFVYPFFFKYFFTKKLWEIFFSKFELSKLTAYNIFLTMFLHTFVVYKCNVSVAKCFCQINILENWFYGLR